MNETNPPMIIASFNSCRASSNCSISMCICASSQHFWRTFSVSFLFSASCFCLWIRLYERVFNMIVVDQATSWKVGRRFCVCVLTHLLWSSRKKKRKKRKEKRILVTETNVFTATSYIQPVWIVFLCNFNASLVRVSSFRHTTTKLLLVLMRLRLWALRQIIFVQIK